MFQVLSNTQSYFNRPDLGPTVCKGYQPKIFWCSQGPKFWPHSQWSLGDFFPNFEKNPNFQKKIFLEAWDFHSVNTHTYKSYMVTFPFNLMSIV